MGFDILAQNVIAGKAPIIDPHTHRAQKPAQLQARSPIERKAAPDIRKGSSKPVQDPESQGEIGECSPHGKVDDQIAIVVQASIIFACRGQDRTR